jgi:hypothetical protein
MVAMIKAEMKIIMPEAIKVITTIIGSEESSLWRQSLRLGRFSGLVTNGFSKSGSRTK